MKVTAKRAWWGTGGKRVTEILVVVLGTCRDVTLILTNSATKRKIRYSGIWEYDQKGVIDIYLCNPAGDTTRHHMSLASDRVYFDETYSITGME